MKFPLSVTPRRLAAQAVIAIMVVAATAAGVALADTGASTPIAPPVAETSAAPDPIASRAQVALDGLVSHGTINQSQADTIEQNVVAGSIDPRTLVADGLVTDAQMQAVGATLDRVKRSAGR